MWILYTYGVGVLISMILFGRFSGDDEPDTQHIVFSLLWPVVVPLYLALVPLFIIFAVGKKFR